MIQIPGGVIDIEVAPDLRDFPAKLESGVQGAIGVAGKIGGALGLAIGVGAAGQAVFDLGNSFTTELGTLQAVSGATADQLQKVKDAAMGLGNDNALADTSAVDAAAAMTELAKGGFTVEQAMTAARGTLQLAGAAQIDAAQAATIQSQALQAFGLDADYAAKAADVLANGANASSAEITDIAMGLQQAGTVAHGFGISMEDTVTTLAMFANAGITGSDAGTLMKSSLLALTDQGKPAQAAIEELGLTVYNENKQFVGMRSLFDQLAEASKNMSQEQFQAATNTLFGSDAIRQAMVAAQQGAPGFDRVAEAIGKQGSAAEVAAAKTQGLPGAISSVQNAAEGLALEVYDLVDGPLEQLTKSGAQFLTDVTPKIVSGLSSVADIAVDVGSALAPAAGAVGDLAKAFLDLPAPVQATVAAFAGIKAFDVDDKAVSWIDTAKEKFSEFRDLMDEVRTNMAENMLEEQNPTIDASTHAGQLEQINSLLEENEEQVSDVTAALGALEAGHPAIARMGDAYRNTTQRARELSDQHRTAASQTTGLSSALRNASASAIDFGGRIGGVAAAGASGLKTAVGGLVSAFGGPWMLGMAAAGMAVSSLVANIQQAQQLTDQYDQALRTVAESQTDMFSTLVSNGGVIDDTVFGQLAQQVTGVSEAFRVAGENDAKWNNVASDMIGDLIKLGDSSDDISFKMDEVALANRRAQEALDKTGLSAEHIAQKVGGSAAEFATFRTGLVESGEGGELAAEKLGDLRKKLLEQQEASQRVTPGTYELSEAFALLADEAANADDKSSALKRALDALAGIPPDLQEATAAYNDVVRDTAQATAEVWDQSKGWGDQLINQDGTVQTATENGRALFDQLRTIRDATADVAAAGGDMDAALAQNRTQFEQLSAATGVSVDEIITAARMLGYNEGAFNIAVQLAGADGVTYELGTISTALDALKPGEPRVVEVKTLTDDAQARLEELGFEVEKITENGVTTFRVEAQTGLAESALDAVLAKLLETGGVTAVPQIDADATTFTVTNEDVLAKLREIDTTQVNPAVGAVIDDFLAGRDVTLAELAKIDETKASSEVLMLIEQARKDAKVISDAIDDAAKDREAQIKVRMQRQLGMSDADWSRMQAAANAAMNGNAAGGMLPAYAGGGRMPTTGPGTERTDGIYAVTPDGTPIAMVDGGEWIVNSRSSEKHGPLLAAINRDDPRLAALPAFAEGGSLVMSMVRAVQSKFPGMEFTSGLRFTDNGYHSKDQAADFSDGYDSTPTMRALAAWIADNYAGITLQLIHQPFDRNIGQGQGFVGDGLGFYGAGTMSEHRDHVHWAVSEPVGNPAPGSSSGDSYRRRPRNKETWDTEDDLKLDSARISVVQAREDLDKALADPKKSQADKDQAANKVEQAEEKVRKLEEQKAAAEQGGMAIPPAPELTTSYTDDELRLRDLERAVDEAKWDRDEVYADPEAAPWERDEADDKLQRAINSLTAEQREQRLAFAPEAPALTGRMSDDQLRIADLEDAVREAELDRNAVYADPRSTDEDRDRADRELQKALNARDEGKAGGEGLTGSSIAELFGNAAKAAVQGQVEDAFGVIGLTNGGSGAIGTAIGLGVEAITKQAQLGPTPTVTARNADADIAPGGEARDEWLRELVNSLKIPAVLRDVGGPLPHGMAGLNLSGETEWVQTAADRKRFDRDMEELAVLRSERGGSGAGAGAGQLTEIAGQLRQLVERPPIQHTSQYYGYEQSEAHRRERDRVDQYSRTYLRR